MLDDESARGHSLRLVHPTALIEGFFSLVERFDAWRFGPGIRISATIAIVAYIAVLRRVPVNGPFPFSTDAMGHLYRVRYFSEQLKHGHIFPQWTPDWYLGVPLVEFYPPAVTYLLGPIAAISSVAIAYKIFVAAVILASGILTALLFRSRLGTQGAIAAGLLYALSPWLLRTVFNEGNMPVSLFAALLPVSMWFMLRL